MGKQKIYCAKCDKKCSGEVLRVADKHFHKSCFQCCQCKKSLATGGFFTKDGAYYCIPDYQRLYGTKCAVCQQYVEGEVVSTMNKTYHQKCFTCSKCKNAFKSGSKVTNTGKEVLCENCVSGIPSPNHVPVDGGGNIVTDGIRKDGTISPTPVTESPTRATAHQQVMSGVISDKAHLKDDYDPNDCAGCGELLKEGQALVALDRQWHVWCFRCKACNSVLNGEYMGKDGIPYCEKCYQKSFGVKCAYCNRFISGKVLQAGDNHHFHPTCARCTKCGDPFGDGEEMYLQGSAIWHPRCGPGPSESGLILNGGGGGASVANGNFTDTECDRMSSSALSEMHYRTVSPGLILREYGRPGHEDISRIYTYSYLTDAPHYLRKPIDPYDKTPLSPHFHRPSSYSTAGSVSGSRPPSRPHSRSRSAMKVLVDAIRSETPRPKSPGMNNEEPIELSHYPAAKKPPPGEKPKIERDDFPAPPYPYTDPERRRRYSDSYKGVPASDDDDEVDNLKNGETDTRLQREAEELEKLNSGIGSAIAKDLKEHAKYRKWKQHNLDPRNASRTPSASKEPMHKLRYESPIGASPSRNLDHQRPFYEDEMFERSTSYRGSLGKSLGNAPSYNGKQETNEYALSIPYDLSRSCQEAREYITCQAANEIRLNQCCLSSDRNILSTYSRQRSGDGDKYKFLLNLKGLYILGQQSILINSPHQEARQISIPRKLIITCQKTSEIALNILRYLNLTNHEERAINIPCELTIICEQARETPLSISREDVGQISLNIPREYLTFHNDLTITFDGITNITIERKNRLINNGISAIQ